MKKITFLILLLFLLISCWEIKNTDIEENLWNFTQESFKEINENKKSEIINLEKDKSIENNIDSKKENKNVKIIEKKIFLEKNILNEKLEKIYNKIIENKKKTSEISSNWKESFNELKKINIEDRKIICSKLMNEYKKIDPELAFYSANCLLYNGYWKLAIPLFAEYIYWEENKKYFNWRIWYWWLHSSDWYNVWWKILFNMTGNKDLFTWVGEEIQKEVLENIDKYKKINKDIFQILMKTELKKISKSESFIKLTENEKKEFLKKQLECSKLTLNLSWISCEFNRKPDYINCSKNFKNVSEKCSKILQNRPKYQNCKKIESKENTVSIKCRDNWKEEIILNY